MYRYLGVILALLVATSYAEQQADSQLNFQLEHPHYAAASGPRVAIDAGHHNFHTASGRFQVFARLLLADGYRVTALDGESDAATLNAVDILVIANALQADSVKDWSRPPKSAFNSREIATLNQWVAAGGALLLIADHQPFPGAAYELARSFGFHLYNGYALDRTRSSNQGQLSFSRAEHNLHEHEITEGISVVTTYLGHAFLAPATAQPLLSLDSRHHLFLPLKAGAIDNSSRHIPVDNWLQGATLEYGKGRLIVLAEAGGLTGQINSETGKRIGLAHPDGRSNVHFILNMMKWLHTPK